MERYLIALNAGTPRATVVTQEMIKTVQRKATEDLFLGEDVESLIKWHETCRVVWSQSRALERTPEAHQILRAIMMSSKGPGAAKIQKAIMVDLEYLESGLKWVKAEIESSWLCSIDNCCRYASLVLFNHSSLELYARVNHLTSGRRKFGATASADLESYKLECAQLNKSSLDVPLDPSHFMLFPSVETPCPVCLSKGHSDPVYVEIHNRKLRPWPDCTPVPEDNNLYTHNPNTSRSVIVEALDRDEEEESREAIDDREILLDPEARDTGKEQYLFERGLKRLSVCGHLPVVQDRFYYRGAHHSLRPGFMFQDLQEEMRPDFRM